MELTHLKIEEYDSNVSDEVEQMTKEIKKLKKRYSEGNFLSKNQLQKPFLAKKKIESCLEDNCFREKMVFTSAELKS